MQEPLQISGTIKDVTARDTGVFIKIIISDEDAQVRAQELINLQGQPVVIVFADDPVAAMERMVKASASTHAKIEAYLHERIIQEELGGFDYDSARKCLKSKLGINTLSAINETKGQSIVKWFDQKFAEKISAGEMPEKRK